MPPRWTKENDAYVDRRTAEGANYTTIAGELGPEITAAAIAGRMRRRILAADGREPISAAVLDERLTTEGCRWVIGDPGRGGDWRWCGAKIIDGSWCAEHAAIGRMRGGSKLL